MSDSMQNTVITVDPKGNIGADFTGHVFAQGLDLFAAEEGTEPDDRRIRWLRESDGKVLAFLAGGHGADGGSLALATLSPGTSSAPSKVLVKTGIEPDTGYVDVYASAAKSGGKHIRLLDDNGLSDLLKLAVQADVKLAFGVNEVEFPGATPLSKKTALAHSLGRVPIAVVACVGPEEVEQGAIPRTRNYTKTTFTVQLRQWEGASPPAATKVRVAWIAIG